jgi:hypothetical protein
MTEKGYRDIEGRKTENEKRRRQDTENEGELREAVA